MNFDVDQHLYRLNSDLWGRADMLQSTDPAKAAKFARAAMMLGVLSSYDLYGGFLINHVTGAPAKTKRLLDLPDGKFEELGKLIAARFALQGGSSSMIAGIITDMISGQKTRPVDVALVNRVVQEYDQTFRKGVPELGTRFRTIGYVWEFLNLLKERNSADGQAAVRQLLETWKKDFPDPDLTRWIDQALTRKGPLPGTMVGFMVNGKMVTAAEFANLPEVQNAKDPLVPLIKALMGGATQPATTSSPPP